MSVDVYNQNKEKTGTIELPDKIFKAKWNPDLVHQVVVSEAANRRRPVAHTKTRGEVRGGGRKPWRQKGTGRARHGSIRSPLWAGGGVVFGPRKEKKLAKKVNKKMKHAALFSLLSKKVSDDELRILNELKLPNHKTKNMVDLMKNFLNYWKSLLIIPAQGNKNIFMAARNIPKVKVLDPRSLNVYDCLIHQYILLEKEAVPQIIAHFKLSH